MSTVDKEVFDQILGDPLVLGSYIVRRPGCDVSLQGEW